MLVSITRSQAIRRDAYTQRVLELAPNSHYRLDELTAGDGLGPAYGPVDMIRGAATFSWYSTGRSLVDSPVTGFRRASHFSGQEVGVAVFPETAQMSITAWASPQATSGYRGISSDKRDTSAAEIGSYFAVNGSNRRLVFQAGDGVSSSWSIQSADDAVTLNVWQHVAVTVDVGSEAALYVNGTRVASLPGGSVPYLYRSMYWNTYGQKTRFLAANPAATKFVGDLAEISHFFRSLTASEIYSLAQAGRPR